MLVRNYSGEQRRALNIIWNAAGDYSLVPVFMAFARDGSPDFYMNTVVGLSCKYFDSERLRDFFGRVSSFVRRDEFDDLLWLGIESAVYQREEGERLSLSALRREHGEDFFREHATFSRQQMMLQSMLTLNQQEARWAFVTGRRAPVLTPKETRIRDRLLFPGTDDTDALLERMRDFLKEFFRADVDSALPLRGRRMFRRPRVPVDRLVVRVGGSGDPSGRLRRNEHGFALDTASKNRAEDLEFIREHFGEAVIKGSELEGIRQKLITGADSGADIYFAGETVLSGNRELKDAALQGERNRAYVRDNARFITSARHRLASRLEAALSDHSFSLPEEGRGGKLEAGKAYRLPVFKDGRVFLRDGEEKERDISVLLLLDASTSRMNTQELIAAQSVLISGALESCSVPTLVAAFRSLRGITVLQILKDFGARDDDGILRYFASGWNRDSLALRASSLLMDRYDKKSRGMMRKHIIMVLTDASPNDSVGIPSPSGRGRDVSYEGEPAVRAASDAADEVRGSGAILNALYYGSGANLENLHRIYGKNHVRIRALSQIGLGVAELLESSLRELEAREGRVYTPRRLEGPDG